VCVCLCCIGKILNDIDEIAVVCGGREDEVFVAGERTAEIISAPNSKSLSAGSFSKV